MINPLQEKALAEANLKEQFKADYYSKWARKNKFGGATAEQGPRVAAIMPTPHGVIVCDMEGKMNCYASYDWSKIVWRGQLQPPPNPAKSPAKFGIFYAIYDSVADRIYFVLTGIYDDQSIYWASRRSIPASTSKAPAHLDILKMSEEDKAGRYFLGLSVDAQRRLLFACACDNDLSIWSLHGYDSIDAKLIATIDCKAESIAIDPRFCAHYVVSRRALRLRKPLSSTSSSNGVYKLTTTSVNSFDSALSPMEDDNLLLIAISDFINNSVSLFAIDDAKFTEYVEACQVQDPQSIEIQPEFTRVTTILKSSYKKRPGMLQRDFLNCPCEITFDPAGNLLVADQNNDRLQIFAVIPDVEQPNGSITTSDGGSVPKLQLFSMWQSMDSRQYKQREEYEVPSLWRVAIGINPKINRPSAIVAGTGYLDVTRKSASELYLFD